MRRLLSASGSRERLHGRDWHVARQVILLSVGLFASCSWNAQEDPFATALSVSVADLELHLRDDSYRSFGHVTQDGRNVFEVTRWRLERLQRQRAIPPERWSADDIVLEFARARTLERLHLYRDAADAYMRVSERRSRLAVPAALALRSAERFAAHVRPLQGRTPEEELAAIEARIAEWTELAQTESDPGYASLAREEVEGWEMRRVELFAGRRSRAEAIAACVDLLKHHSESKLYPQHLVRLAGLHAESAREEVIRARTEHIPLGESAYEKHFQEALSAYELASETRNALLRREAQSRLQSLLLFHDEVLSSVY